MRRLSTRSLPVKVVVSGVPYLTTAGTPSRFPYRSKFGDLARRNVRRVCLLSECRLGAFGHDGEQCTHASPGGLLGGLVIAGGRDRRRCQTAQTRRPSSSKLCPQRPCRQRGAGEGVGCGDVLQYLAAKVGAGVEARRKSTVVVLTSHARLGASRGRPLRPAGVLPADAGEGEVRRRRRGLTI